MFLSLPDVRRVTTRLAAEHDQEVIAVTGTGSDAAYTEVFVRVEGSGAESNRLIIGVNRDVSESSLRKSFESELQSQLHQQDSENGPGSY
jgi:hypothetical protein